MCNCFRLGLDVEEEEEAVPAAEEAAPVATEEVAASAMEEID